MKILLIEDDNLYSDELETDLKADRAISESIPRIDLVSSEREFRERFEEIAEANYDFAIIDMMVLWERSRPDRKKPPQDVLDGGIYRAGFRCMDWLRKDSRTKDLPIVIHTNFSDREVPDLQKKYQGPLTRFLPKSGEKEPLLTLLREWLASRTALKS